MSRIGNTPIIVPKEATVVLENTLVSIKGPKGELRLKLPIKISLKLQGDRLDVVCKPTDKKMGALHGLVRAQLANYLRGVTQGWSKTLELSGVGYRATMDGINLVLSIGFSHPVTITPPPGISFSVAEGKINIIGIDKQLVGQVAASIREIKKPEPYKGKGIKYLGEHIRKKAGKAAKAIGAAVAAAK